MRCRSESKQARFVVGREDVTVCDAARVFWRPSGGVAGEGGMRDGGPGEAAMKETSTVTNLFVDDRRSA